MDDVYVLDESGFCCATQKWYGKEKLPWFWSESKSSLLLSPKYELQYSPYRDFLQLVILGKAPFLPFRAGVWPSCGKSPFHVCSVKRSDCCIIQPVWKGQSRSPGLPQSTSASLCCAFEYSEAAAKIQRGEVITFQVVTSVFFLFPLTDE